MADIQMSFPIIALLARSDAGEFRQLRAWLNNLQARPAWQRAIEKGGPLEIPAADAPRPSPEGHFFAHRRYRLRSLR